LKIDSLTNPDGPTQTATRGLARQVADQWRGFEQRRKPNPPRPLTTPAPPPVSAVAMSDMDARIKQVQDALTADQAAELTRLADGLSKTRTPGAIAGDISEAINTDGLKAVAEFKVVRDRLAKIGTPEQVRALDRAVIGQLPPQIRNQIEGLFNPKPIQPDIKPETDRPITAIPLPSPNRPVHPERERDEIQLRELSAGTDDGDGTGRDKGGSGSDITIRMPEGQEDLSISIGADAADEDKADALIDIANALKTQKAGEDDTSDELIRDVGEGVLSLVPGVGNVLSARDAYYAFQAAAKAYEKGDTTEAGIQAALGVVDAIGAIPGPGNLVKGAKQIVGLMVKGGRRFLKKNAPTPKGDTTPSTPSPGKRPEPENKEGRGREADRYKLPDVSVTKNPISVEDFNKLPENGKLDANRVRTMQNNIKSEFKDKRSVIEMVSDLKSEKLKPEDIKPISIAEIKGKVYTLDHRRLVAHRLAGKPVKYRKAKKSEIDDALDNDKMSSRNGGMSIIIKRSGKK